jgi:hypothetical protein
VKKQQMQWTLRGAHLLLQTRTKVLNNELEEGVLSMVPRGSEPKPPDPRLLDALMLMAEELTRRQLKLPAEAPAETSHAPTLFAKIWALLRHRSPRQADRAKTV